MHRYAKLGRLLVAAGLVVLAGCAPAPEVGPDLAGGIEAFLSASRTGKFDQVRAVVVDVDGDRRYVRGDPSARGDVGSVTQSVVATLVGIAIADGHLRGVDQTLGELLPSYTPVLAPSLRTATLRNVLTMTAGTAPDRAVEGRPPTTTEDWAAYAATLEPRTGPGTWFEYSSVSSHLLSAVLTQALDRPVVDYARETLFDPLGIDTGPASGFAWTTDPQGRPLGGSGLRLGADDLVAIGRLYLDGGLGDGRQIVPASWVAAATRAQVTTRLPLAGYGYQWWVTEADGHPAHVAAGYGGQLIEVVPDLRLVVVVTSDVGAVPGAPPEAYADLVDTVVAPSVGSR